MKQRGLSRGESEGLEAITICAMVAMAMRGGHIAYNEGNIGAGIVSIGCFLLAGYAIYSTTYDVTDLKLAGNYSDFVNHSDNEL